MSEIQGHKSNEVTPLDRIKDEYPSFIIEIAGEPLLHACLQVQAAKEKCNPQSSVYRYGSFLDDLYGNDFVGGGDGGFEVFGRQVGVAFGRLQLVVAELLLDVADAGAATQQVRGEAMPAMSLKT
jgi:hypothetical protein